MYIYVCVCVAHIYMCVCVCVWLFSSFQFNTISAESRGSANACTPPCSSQVFAGAARQMVSVLGFAAMCWGVSQGNN